MSRTAISFEERGRAAVVQLPDIAAAPGQLLIETTYSLISIGTERTMLTHAPAYPYYPGYSVVGEVIAVGDGVTEFVIGERVVANAPHAAKVACDARFCAKVDEGIRSEDAAFFNIGAMAIHVIRLAGVKMGDPTLILGQGLIGLLAAQVARLAGGMPVIGVDVVEERLALARRLGADATYNAGDRAGLEAMLGELPGGGAAATIELSGVPEMIDRAIDWTQRRGRVVVGSLAPQGHDTNLFGRAWLEGISLIGSYYNARPWRIDAVDVTSPLDWPLRLYDSGRYPHDDVSTGLGDTVLFLRMMKAGRLSVAPLVTMEVDPAGAAAMFNDGPGNTIGALVKW